MDNSFMMMFDIIALGCGVYCLFTFFKLRLAGGRLFPNTLLVPNGKKPKDCLDAAEYIRYLQPKLLVLGIVTTAFGVVSMLDTFFDLFGLLVSEILTFTSFGVVVWYGVCSGKANKRYW